MHGFNDYSARNRWKGVGAELEDIKFRLVKETNRAGEVMYYPQAWVIVNFITSKTKWYRKKEITGYEYAWVYFFEDDKGMLQFNYEDETNRVGHENEEESKKLIKKHKAQYDKETKRIKKEVKEKQDKIVVGTEYIEL
jgi:hypothetical protein